jgi:iron complex outermembrane receptor protein
MTLSLRLLLAALAAASHLPAAEPSNRAVTFETPVELDLIEVRTNKDHHFSLPLDSVATAGSRLGLTSRELPASISIVTQEMMQLRGLRTAVEAVEAAVGMTGGTQFGSIPSYSTRGFGGNNVSILRDGIRQNTASQSSRTVDSFVLDRIEILKGPDGLMYGEGAIGGAVNYISKAPDTTVRGEVLVSIGPWDTYRFGIGSGGPILMERKTVSKLPGRAVDLPAAFTYRFDFSHHETKGYQDRNAQRYDAFALAVGWRISPAVSLTWFGTFLDDHSESYYGTPVIYDAVVNTTIPGAQPETRVFNAATDRMINPRLDPATRRTNYNIVDNYAAAANSFNRLRADARLSPDVDLRAEAYGATQLLKWRNVESNIWNPTSRLITRGSFALIYRDDLLLGTRLDVTLKNALAGRPNRLVFGGMIERNDQIRGGAPGNVNAAIAPVSLTNPDVGYGPAARFTKTARIVVATRAFHVQNVLDLTRSLKVVAGLRYDTISLQRDTLANPTTATPTPFSTFQQDYSPLTGRLGAVWLAHPQFNLYASASRAAEPVAQLVSLNPTQADFSLQKGRQFEVGAKGSWWDGRVDATIALFDLRKEDILTSTLDAETGLRRSQQIGAQESRGAEVAFAVSPPGRWRVELNGAFTDAAFANFNENLGTGVISRTGNRPANVPRWIANMFVAKRFSNGFALSGGPRYVSDRFANTNNSVVSEGYVTVDAAATYTWGKWHFTLRGRNLLDEDYEPVAGTTMQRLADPLSAEFSTRLGF